MCSEIPTIWQSLILLKSSWLSLKRRMISDKERPRFNMWGFMLIWGWNYWWHFQYREDSLVVLSFDIDALAIFGSRCSWITTPPSSWASFSPLFHLDLLEVLLSSPPRCKRPHFTICCTPFDAIAFYDSAQFSAPYKQTGKILQYLILAARLDEKRGSLYGSTSSKTVIHRDVLSSPHLC